MKKYLVVESDTDLHMLVCWSADRIGYTTDLKSLLTMNDPLFVELDKQKFAERLAKNCTTKSDIEEGLAAGTIISELIASVDRVLADQDHAGISDFDA